MSKLKKVSTPSCSEAQLAPLSDMEGEGQLAPIAAKVLKVLYAARLCRPDLSHAVTMLARQVSNWAVVCDAKLHRLTCCIACTVHLVQRSFVRAALRKCKLVLCPDQILPRIMIHRSHRRVCF